LLEEKERELDDVRRENNLLKETLQINKSDRLKDQNFINQLQNEIGFMTNRMELFTESASKVKQETVTFDKRSIDVLFKFINRKKYIRLNNPYVAHLIDSTEF
jgi:hypothetical protein